MYYLSTMPFGCFWSDGWWCLPSGDSETQAPSSRGFTIPGASLWSCPLDPLHLANRWGARMEDYVAGFYGQPFHLHSIGQNSLTCFYLTSKEAGKQGLSVSPMRKEKRFDERLGSLCNTFQRVLLQVPQIHLSELSIVVAVQRINLTDFW